MVSNPEGFFCEEIDCAHVRIWMHARREASWGKCPSIQRYLEVKRVPRWEVLHGKHKTNQSTYTRYQSETYLRHDQKLRKLGEPDNMIKQLCLLLKVICPGYELQRIIVLSEKQLRALLVLIGLAQDLRCIDPQVLVARPIAIDDIVLHEIPVPPVVMRVPRLCATAFATHLAVHVANPYQVITSGMEAQHLRTEGVRWRGSVHLMPETTSVCRVKELVGVGDEVRAVLGVCVHVEC
jgi:hypothetical protein